MARQLRKKSGTGIYHVMVRGINRQDIFEDEEDYLQFLKIFHTMVEKLSPSCVPMVASVTLRRLSGTRRALLKRIILKIKDEIKQKRFKVLLSEASPLILAPIGGLR